MNPRDKRKSNDEEPDFTKRLCEEIVEFEKMHFSQYLPDLSQSSPDVSDIEPSICEPVYPFGFEEDETAQQEPENNSPDIMDIEPSIFELTNYFGFELHVPAQQESENNSPDIMNIEPSIPEPLNTFESEKTAQQEPENKTNVRKNSKSSAFKGHYDKIRSLIPKFPCEQKKMSIREILQLTSAYIDFLGCLRKSDQRVCEYFETVKNELLKMSIEERQTNKPKWAFSCKYIYFFKFQHFKLLYFFSFHTKT